jgi:hypothetical protein
MIQALSRKQARKNEIVWTRIRASSLRVIAGMPAHAALGTPSQATVAITAARDRSLISTDLVSRNSNIPMDVKTKGDKLSIPAGSDVGQRLALEGGAAHDGSRLALR